MIGNTLKEKKVKMDKPVKSGKEILDEFFKSILKIPQVDKSLASEIEMMYAEGKLTSTNLSNKLAALKEEELK